MKKHLLSLGLGFLILSGCSICNAKSSPSWPTPTTLRVVDVDSKDTHWMMTLAALQGLVNRQAPGGNMIYLEIDGFPDRTWREYYASRLGLSVVETSSAELLNWVRANTNIRYYIVVDPYTNPGGLDQSHTCTINIACTMAGIFGNAVPVHPSKTLFFRTHGFRLLPDSYRNNLGPGGTILRRPMAFDLRNQWKTKFRNAPWMTRQDAYRWALDTLLPLVDHHAVTLNYGFETLSREGIPMQFEPWINDYSIGVYCFSPKSNDHSRS